MPEQLWFALRAKLDIWRDKKGMIAVDSTAVSSADAAGTILEHLLPN